jgi:hypothetical protein
MDNGTESKEQAEADAAEGRSEQFWCFLSLLALFGTIACGIAGYGNNTTACSVIFAAAVYGYHHRV